MIRPLKRARNRWIIDWFDFTEPVVVPSLGEFCLPTCLLVIAEGSFEVMGSELLREIDQRRIERFVGRLMDERSTPDELVLAEDAGWDRRLWEGFAESCRCSLRMKPRNAKPMVALFEQVDRIKQDMAERLAKAAVAHTRSAGGSAVVAESLVRGARKVLAAEKRRLLLQKALEWDARCYEAWLDLGDGDLEANDVENAHRAYEEVLQVTHPGWKERRILEWADPEMKAALKAAFGMVMIAWHQGDYQGAVQQAEWLLSVDPRDHQGLRFHYPMLQLLCEQVEQAMAFFDEYEKRFTGDFHEPGFYFGWGLTLSLVDREQEAARRYRMGMARNLHIAPLLLDLPEPSYEIWHANDRAESQYAMEYLDSFGALWEREVANLRSLREVYESSWTELEALWELRGEMQRMQDQRFDPQHEKAWETIAKREKSLIAEIDRVGE